MNEDELQARLVQMQAQLQQATALGQQYGLTPQQASQQMQVYNQLANSGRFQGTLADYFAQRAQGAVPTPGIQWPAPSQPPGLLDPPTTVGGEPPSGPITPGGPSVGGEPRDPRIPTTPVLRPPTGGVPGAGGPGGQLPTLPNVPGSNPDTLAAFGYMRGPNGEILPQMLQGGWSPYQSQGPMPQQQGFAADPGNTLQLPRLGYDPNLEGFQWFTPPPASAPPGSQPTTPTTPTTPSNPLIPPPQTGGPPRGGQPIENQIQRLGLLGLAAQKSGLPPALAGLLG